EAASQIVLSGFPSTVGAGTSNGVNVELRDPFGNLAVDYLGSVHFTSSDPQAVLPSDYTFTSADAGRHSFVLTLKTAGTQSVGLRDTVSSGLTGSFSTTVSPGAASRLTLTLSGGNLVEDNLVLDAAVSAFDSFNNLATGYTGTIHFTSSDPAAILPADYAF